jgi:hypothetical protein
MDSYGIKKITGEKTKAMTDAGRVICDRTDLT